MIAIGLGSNVGNRRAMLEAACSEVAPLLTDIHYSACYETPALLPPHAPKEWDMPFLNMVIAGKSALLPEALLAELQKIEQKLGKQKRGHWAPREIDIDLLVYHDAVIDSPTLQLPHPEILNRYFVLAPLVDVAPELVLQGKTTKQWLAIRHSALDAGSQVTKKTKLVGILNFTPDSFSDGGKYNHVSQALAQVDALVAAGADVVDIGAESTRPNATPLTADEELARLAPLFVELKPARFPVKFSIDTRHAQTAKTALDKGFCWVNDVNGFKDIKMREAVSGYDCTCVIMHSLTVPADKSVTLPENCDVMAVLKDWANSLPIRGKIILDPGIGFGKTSVQSWQIIERIAELKMFGVPLLIGHSRKSFLNSPPLQGKEKDSATIEVSKKLIAAGVDYLRVHDVAAHKKLLSSCEAQSACAGSPPTEKDSALSLPRKAE